MTDTILQQDPKVVSELERRFKLMMDNIDELGSIMSGSTGSMTCFRMSLAPVGYPLGDAPSFMDEEYRKPCMTRDEFHDDLYDPVFERLFNQVPKK
jgi:hypothetical protein